MIFPKEKLEEILRIIDFNHTLFIGNSVGVDILTDEDRALLKKFGVNTNSIKTPFTQYEQSFYFGRLAQALGNENASKLGYNDFLKYLRKGQYVPLNTREKASLDFAKQRSYSHIKGLSQKVRQTSEGIIITNDQATRDAYESTIKGSVERAILERDTINSVVSEIGHKTGDWGRDLGRIAATEMQYAYEEGRAAEAERKGGKDAQVYKEVYAQACRFCIKFYTTGGIGTKPIVFTLSDLRANGTNVGRKQKDWIATLSPVHPWCFNNKHTSIFTADGLKPIKDIRIGDLVLTHRNRFRKVTSIMERGITNETVVFNIAYKFKNRVGGISTKVLRKITSEHPVFDGVNWVKAGDLETGDKILLQGIKCENCDNIIPINYTSGDKNYPSICLSCTNSRAAKEQWKVDGMKGKIGLAVSKGNIRRFENTTIEERRKVTLKARQVYNDKYPNNSSPFFSEESKIKANITNGKKATFIERKLRHFLDTLGIKYSIDFSIKTDLRKSNGYFKFYFPDIYIPSLNIILEADGEVWHNKEKDKIRDGKIKELIGADVFRFTDTEIRNEGGKVFNKIKNIVNNHSGNFKHIEVEIVGIEEVKRVSNSYKTLHNFSVEEDESYVADGIVVHNCRCMLHNIPKGYIWDDERSGFFPPKVDKDAPKKGIKIKIGDKEIEI